MRLRYDMIQLYVLRPEGATYEFLQLRRAAGDYMGGTWQSIYGGIEEGETAWQAALRELKEETGLAPVEFYQLDLVNTFYMAKEDAIWNCPCFCAIVDPDDTITLNAEHDAHRWLDPDEFLNALIWPGDRASHAEITREIIENGPAKKHMQIKLH